MQPLQFPKIVLRFNKVDTCKVTSSVSNFPSPKFVNLIPEKVKKQVSRLNKISEKENAADMELRSGEILKMKSILSFQTSSKTFRNDLKSPDSDIKISHSLRKLRLVASFHAEIINFFSSSAVPRLLRTDYGIFIINNVSSIK